MNNDDSITVVEDYCIACKGTCTNEDPADYDHLMVEWEALAGAWVDRGASASDVWSFVASVVLDVARQNDISWDELQEVLWQAWKHGQERD